MLLTWMFSKLPRRPLTALFGALGVALWFLGLRRRVVMENLRLAFPEKTTAERRAIARSTYRHLGEMVPAFLRIPFLPAKVLGRIFEYEGWEKFERARALGKGVIACTAHFGHFEVLAAAHNLRGIPITIISRRMKVGLWERARTRAGVQDLAVGNGRTLSAATRALRAGRVLGYVIDQSEPGDNAVFPTFFGVPVATAPMPAVLSRRTGAPVIFTLSLPLPDGRHHVVIEGPLFPRKSGDARRDNLAFMQELNDRLEAWIRRRPEQWYWLHRRWKRRGAPLPDGLQTGCLSQDAPGDAGAPHPEAQE